ncbi:DNA primase [Streptomyces sp. NPDC007904]|jgi:membrane protein involved in colicin uptake|uniref:DNA primase n=1 Tax=Streptomyces sp. NPDC007904 TaxID=3364787 RepID=UPI0036E1F302
MNRTGLGLAIGAGYLLGRTKKLKMAVAVGGLVAGKKLNLSPKMVAELVSQQLQNNPQFKEIGDQLRGELRGVGKAASGALVERQLNSLADRLQGRTADVRDRLTGAARPDRDAEDAEDADDADNAADEDADDAGRDEEDREPPERPAKKAPAEKAAKRPAGAKATAKRVPGKKAAPAKKTAAKKTAAKKTSAGRSAATRTASRGNRSRSSEGGGEQ